MSNDASSFLAIDGIIMTWLLDYFFVLTNFLTLSDTLFFKYFLRFLSKIWILPIKTTILRHNDVNEIMPRCWKSF